jgi:hypothetical protein
MRLKFPLVDLCSTLHQISMDGTAKRLGNLLPSKSEDAKVELLDAAYYMLQHDLIQQMHVYADLSIPELETSSLGAGPRRYLQLRYAERLATELDKQSSTTLLR